MRGHFWSTLWDGGYPNSWIVEKREDPLLKWMMTRGSPILGNLDIETIGSNIIFAVGTNGGSVGI